MQQDNGTPGFIATLSLFAQGALKHGSNVAIVEAGAYIVRWDFRCSSEADPTSLAIVGEHGIAIDGSKFLFPLRGNGPALFIGWSVPAAKPTNSLVESGEHCPDDPKQPEDGCRTKAFVETGLIVADFGIPSCCAVSHRFKTRSASDQKQNGNEQNQDEGNPTSHEKWLSVCRLDEVRIL